MSSASPALAVTPSKVRSKITNDPSQRHGRSAEARRVRDLYASYLAALGGPTDVSTQALILAAAEHVAIAERTRADAIAGKTVDVVRTEGAANRALKRIGLNKAAPPPKGKSFIEKLEEKEAAVQARAAANAADGVDAASDSDERTGEVPSQADGVAA